MIKPNELRVGNYVSYEEENFQIDCVSISYPFLDSDKFGHGVVNYSNINPIRISEEWLLRFGFKRNKNRRRICYFNEMFENHSLELEYGCEYSELFHNDYCLVNVYYVHDLQNIYFALTGSELVFSTEP